MAEYLSPGVYVEEFDSGIKAMEGVGTSTAGFIGMAQKGPVRGLPVLITSMADYQRRFGGYLPERIYGEMRYLPNAVEQFFNNGGSACYVMRVCREAAEGGAGIGESGEGGAGTGESGEGAAGEGAAGEGGAGTGESGEGAAGEGGAGTGKSGEGAQGAGGAVNEGMGATLSSGHLKAVKGKLDANNHFLTMKSANPGAWGNRIQARFTLTPRNRTQADMAEGDGVRYTLKGECTFQEGDLVYLQPQSQPRDNPQTIFFNQVTKAEGNTITLKWDTGLTEDDRKAIILYLAEWSLMVWDDTMSELYEGVSFHPDRNNYIEHAVLKSQLITASADMEKFASGVMEQLIESSKEPSFAMEFSGGDDGKIEFDASLYLGKDGSPDKRTGLEAFKTLPDVSIMAIPGITDKAVQSALVSHCEGLTSRFAILDMPLDAREAAELQEFRENVDSSYAAMYHPWLQCYDPSVNRNVFLPPSGAVAGIYGRTDNTRGVHKAPANETVRNCTGLSIRYNEAEQGRLNPKGINLIRALPGQGIRVWGARTCSSDGNWKYVNVRRLFIYIEESIKANTNWAVFEPNDEMLWSRVEGTIRVFLTTQWRNGALAGSTAEEAFFINIGKSTMTEDDILNGRLICVIGVAPVRPAEFVIFRITQKMESAQ